jgi:hypothetical protein
MVPAPLIVLFLVMGIGVGISLGIVLGKDKAHSEQFSKDCKTMAHATIQHGTDNICVKNGRVLFSN